MNHLIQTWRTGESSWRDRRCAGRDGAQRRPPGGNLLLADPDNRGSGAGVRSLAAAELRTREGGERGGAGEGEGSGRVSMRIKTPEFGSQTYQRIQSKIPPSLPGSLDDETTKRTWTIILSELNTERLRAFNIEVFKMQYGLNVSFILSFHFILMLLHSLIL